MLFYNEHNVTKKVYIVSIFVFNLMAIVTVGQNVGHRQHLIAENKHGKGRILLGYSEMIFINFHVSLNLPHSDYLDEKVFISFGCDYLMKTGLTTSSSLNTVIQIPNTSIFIS